MILSNMDTVGLMDGKMPKPTPGIVPNAESPESPVSVKYLTQLVYRRTKQHHEMRGGMGGLIKKTCLSSLNRRDARRQFEQGRFDRDGHTPTTRAGAQRGARVGAAMAVPIGLRIVRFKYRLP